MASCAVITEPSARWQPSKFDDREVQLCWRWLEHAGKPRGREEEEDEDEEEEAMNAAAATATMSKARRVYSKLFASHGNSCLMLDK